jgi:hypothetical protein
MAKRERILTWRLRIDNIRRLGIPLILLSCALAILIIAMGIFVWLLKEERVVEIEKIVEVTREIPIFSEKIKVIEVPVYIEVPKIIEVPRAQIVPLVEPAGTDPLELIETNPASTVAPDVNMNSEFDTEEHSNTVATILESGGAEVGAQLNFALLWENTNDLDLHVETPSGEILFFGKSVIGEGRLDSDKNVRQGLTENAIENIRWEKDAPEGTYKIYVSLYTNRSSLGSASTDFQLVVHQKGQIFGSYAGKVSHSSLRKRQFVASMNFSD